MEKNKSHYSLSNIKNQMNDVGNLRLLASSRRGIVKLGFTIDDAINAIQALTIKDFDKSMTTNRNHKVWQDVYKSFYKEVGLYIKFQEDDEGFFVISFKEL